MFNANKLLGPHSGIAPGSDTELAALAAVRSERNRNAEQRGVAVPARYLGEVAGRGALIVKPDEIEHVIERASEHVEHAPNGEGLSVLPPVQDPEQHLL